MTSSTIQCCTRQDIVSYCAHILATSATPAPTISQPQPKKSPSSQLFTSSPSTKSSQRLTPTKTHRPSPATLYRAPNSIARPANNPIEPVSHLTSPLASALRARRQPSSPLPHARSGRFAQNRRRRWCRHRGSGDRSLLEAWLVGIERPRGAMLPLWVGKRWVWIVVDGPGRVGNAVFNASSAGSSQARLLDIGLSLFIYSLVGWSAVEAVTMRSRFAFARWRFGESLDTILRCSLRISSSPSQSVYTSTKDGHSRRVRLASHQTVRSITLFIIQSPQSRSAVPKLTASEVPSPILKMAATNQRQRPLRSTAWL